MANNEDVFIEKDGKIILFTELYSNKADAAALEIITLSPLTEVNRAMVQYAPAEAIVGQSGWPGSGGYYATVVSGGCSGNAIEVLWEVISGHSFTWASGAVTSGLKVVVVAAGH